MLGDNHGEACAPGLIDGVERWLPPQGLRVRRNQPYAGGFTTQRYGRPGVGRHALQIEINRALYMDEARHTKLPTFGAIAPLMTGLLAEIGDLATMQFAAARRWPPNNRTVRRKKRGRDKHGPSLGRKRPRRAYSKHRGRRTRRLLPTEEWCTCEEKCKRQKEPLIHRLTGFSNVLAVWLFCNAQELGKLVCIIRNAMMSASLRVL